MLLADEMFKKAGNRYILSLVIAKRTKQLNEGATPLIELEGNHKPLFIALQEFLEDKIQFEFVEE